MSCVKNGILYDVHNSEIQNGTFLIPDEVTKIGDSAFWGCRSLQTITIPGSITEIGDYAFDGCKSLKEIVIPAGVTRIGNHAFDSCVSLKEIIIPGSVTKIGGYAFYGCESLQSVIIPESVKKIRNCAFWECKSLTAIIIPAGVTEIGNCAFYGCKSLKEAVIPESAIVICEGAFDHCNSLQSVEIMNPDAVIMDLHPFFCCENLKIVKIGNTVHQVECVDYNCMKILSRKQAGSMEIIHAKYFNNDEESYIAKEDGLSTHGDSIREAMSDLTFKKMQQLDVSEHVARIKTQGYVTPEDYRLVTGACRQGTEQFLKEKGFTWEDRLSIPETLEAVKGYWGAERFTELMTS